MLQNEVKLGMVCFANYSGLGNQTRRLAQILRPFRLLVIDSKSFSKNKTQNMGWYEGFSGYTVDGFPNNREVQKFLDGLTHVMVCENPLNYFLFSHAKAKGIKTFCQSNYEFCDNLNHKEYPEPDLFLMPSHWMVQEMKQKFPGKVMYLPPPIDPNEFTTAREKNINRDGKFRFLHIVGTLAASDRNGTLDLLEALHHTKADFHLTIKSQHELPPEYITDDRRVTYVIDNEVWTSNLYKDFDAMIIPRRYGGLCLTCNEALMAGLPVIMPDISPNNELLPREWLVSAEKKSILQTRVPIDVHGVNVKLLAGKMEWMMDQDRATLKMQAFDLGYDTFSPSSLLKQYEDLFV